MLPFRHQGVYLSTRVVLGWRARHEDEWGRQSNVLGLRLIEECWYGFKCFETAPMNLEKDSDGINTRGSDTPLNSVGWIIEIDSIDCGVILKIVTEWIRRGTDDCAVWWASETGLFFVERRAPMIGQSGDIRGTLWLFGYSNADFRIWDGNLVRSNWKSIATGNCNATMMAFWLSQVTYSVCARALRAHNHVRWPPLGVWRQSNSWVEYELLKRNIVSLVVLILRDVWIWKTV